MGIARNHRDGQGVPERPCIVSNLSNGGAKLIELTAALPDEFLLRLSPRRGPARACRVVWRSKRQAGIQFLEAFPTIHKSKTPAASRSRVMA